MSQNQSFGYPHLERVPQTPAPLDDILAARK
jgi:hypothetical protein